jgi:hypothetical protein
VDVVGHRSDPCRCDDVEQGERSDDDDEDDERGA